MRGRRASPRGTPAAGIRAGRRRTARADGAGLRSAPSLFGTRLLRTLRELFSREPLLEEAALLARNHGCRILLVGGAVRDAALDLPLKDLDFILEGRPARFLAALSLRLGHRTVTFRKRGVVNHRVRAGDREWDFVERGRRSLRRELFRRDFSINAVAWDPLAGTLLDPGGALADLARRRIRAMGPRAFTDDPLRAMRAVRLQAEIPSLSIDRGTQSLIRAAAPLLRRTSVERIKSEWDRILTTPRASRAVRGLDRLGLLPCVLPELEPLRGLEQNRYHHLDAFRHTLAALEAAGDLRALARGLPGLVFSEDPLLAAGGARDLPAGRARLLRWALLLHDTGKAATRTIGEDGEYHFFMHERASARIARGVFRRLKASRDETSAVERLVALHLRLSIPSQGEVTDRALRRIVREAGPLTPLLVLHSLADKIASKGPNHVRTLARLRRAARDLLSSWKNEEARRRREPPYLDGHDVMEALGLPPGPEVGRILREAEERQAFGTLRSREEALDWLLALGRRAPAR